MLFLRETGLWSSRGRFFDSSQFSFVSHSCARAGGPDDLPNWLLKEYADILAAPIAEILNTSFSECKVPRAWKIADVPPLPNPSTIDDINKDLRPISLTSTLSKVAEGFVQYRYGPETSYVIGHRFLTIWIYSWFMHHVRPSFYVPSMATRYGRQRLNCKDCLIRL